MPATESPAAVEACLPDDTLGRLLRGQIPEAEAAPFYQHLIRCAACAVRFRQQPSARPLPTIAGYWIVEEIGRGQSSVVYKAWWRGEPRRPVALKIVRPGNPEQMRRFDRETRVLRDLDCPNIVRCLDSGEEHGTAYYAMELIDGVLLDAYLRHTARSLDERLAVFQRVCRAVAGPHARGVMHRDLKPGNILVDADGEPHILDFGLCAVESEDWSTAVRRAQTELGDVIGTIRYMAPEQAWGGVAGPTNFKTDVWALGVMLYEIATDGGYPFDASATHERSAMEALLHAIRHERPRKPGIPYADRAKALSVLIDRCLAAEPEQRVSALELADDVEALLRRRRLRTAALPWRYRLRRVVTGLAMSQEWVLWMAIVATLLVLVSAAAYGFQVRWAVREDTPRPAPGATAVQPPAGRDQIVIVGISDHSVAEVPRIARQRGIPGVSGQTTSWRGLHGQIMQRLARVRPRAVVWDYYFSREQPDDSQIAAGIRALCDAGVPVTIATRDFDAQGRPRLSARIMGEPGVGDRVYVGCIAARDMVRREGEFVVCLWRNGRGIPWLGLAAVSGLFHPDCDPEIVWRERQLEMSVRYRKRGGGNLYLGEWDRLELTRVFQFSRDERGAMPGDLLLCKALPLSPHTDWERRTIGYESLLQCDDDELRRQCAGRIVVFGNLRSSGPLDQLDRHAVKYADRVIPDVPGCFLVADGIAGLLAHQYFRPLFPISAGNYLAIIVLTLMGCAGAARTARRLPRLVHRHGRLVHVVLALGFLAGWAVLGMSRSWTGVHAGLGATALLGGATGAIWIERLRLRHRPDVSD